MDSIRCPICGNSNFQQEEDGLFRCTCGRVYSAREISEMTADSNETPSELPETITAASPEAEQKQTEAPAAQKSGKKGLVIALCVVIAVLLVAVGVLLYRLVFAPKDTAEQGSKESSEISQSGTNSDGSNGTHATYHIPEDQPVGEMIRVGDVIVFGEFEQDNDSANGKEDVEWIVLAMDKNKVLVVSKYALDARAFDANVSKNAQGAARQTAWRQSTVRSWLNGEFLDTAFNREEQRQILTSSLTTEEWNGSVYETQDKVFLLSAGEVNKYFSTDADRKCRVTSYALARGAHPKYNDGNNWWWLRSPAYDSADAAGVTAKGVVDTDGYYCWNTDAVVRPAMWIDLG